VPTKTGDRVKTDRRNAEKLARCYRAGELTAVWYRLHKRYQAFAIRGKNKNQILTVLGRELLGFVWAIAVHTEAQLKLTKAT